MRLWYIGERRGGEMRMVYLGKERWRNEDGMLRRGGGMRMVY